jgi:hypothetical protein
MTIIRAERPHNKFAIIRNEVLQDERLSFRARGILANILSRPDNWRCSAWDLATEGREGRRAILTALTELETFNYLKRVKSQDDKGHWKTESFIYDQPVDNPDYYVNKSVDKLGDKSSTGVRKPDVGLPNAGKRTLLKELDKELDKTPKPPTALPKKEMCKEHKFERPCRSCAADLKAKKVL